MQQFTIASSIAFLDFLQNKIAQLEKNAARCEHALLDEEEHHYAAQKWVSLQMQREQLQVLKKLFARVHADAIREK
jgi:hypothetical protein